MSQDTNKVAAVVQARTKSTRLPRKVLMDLCGRTLLERVVDRVSKSKTVDEVIVATSDLPCDDDIVKVCINRGYRWVRGSEQDVLGRFHTAMHYTDANIVVRVTADDPFKDPQLIDMCVNVFKEVAKVNTDLMHYVGFGPLKPTTFPVGLDVEVFGYPLLCRAYMYDDTAYGREHVTPYMYDPKNEFLLVNVLNRVDLSLVRLTVDTEEDFRMAQLIYTYFDCDEELTWKDAAGLWLALEGVLL